MVTMNALYLLTHFNLNGGYFGQFLIFIFISLYLFEIVITLTSLGTLEPFDLCGNVSVLLSKQLRQDNGQCRLVVPVAQTDGIPFSFRRT